MARRTEATSNRSNRTPTTRGQKAAARGKKKTKKRRLGALNLHPKRSRNALRAASEVLRRSRALLKCLWRRLGPLPRGLEEAPGIFRGALGRVLGSSGGVSETISGVLLDLRGGGLSRNSESHDFATRLKRKAVFSSPRSSEESRKSSQSRPRRSLGTPVELARVASSVFERVASRKVSPKRRNSAEISATRIGSELKTI